ncbi:Type I restriction modification DNA specificity domain-containing protein [Treponema bryantii]|uniref:Type I restriction modification DNA specificity domain-containing protein n=1 Tax=Treponema bryantii TaxID=163 RepID=A0A1H9A2W0_9SPIR|nr:restriction endonuclease subunit S [Treponema bryantii]SEP70955.1 Type I restriction modification DNA specificity domain-containing protein [Treponema bryantii]
MQLGCCAEIRSGLVLSRKQARVKTENRYSLLTLKSIKPDATVSERDLGVFDAVESLNKEYLTEIGDVIVRTSMPYTSVLIDKKTYGMVVSSNFVIIRCYTDKLLPEYLFWLLNTETVKRDIFKNSAGNMLAAIKPQYFCDLDIELPSLREQKLIADFNMTARKELELLERLKTEKEKLYQFCLEDKNFEFIINKKGAVK